jgi:HNH endonuclease
MDLVTSQVSFEPFEAQLVDLRARALHALQHVVTTDSLEWKARACRSVRGVHRKDEFGDRSAREAAVEVDLDAVIVSEPFQLLPHALFPARLLLDAPTEHVDTYGGILRDRLKRERGLLNQAQEDLKVASGVKLLAVIDDAVDALTRVSADDWQAVCKGSVAEGVYSVTLTGVGESASQERFEPLTVALHAGVPFHVAEELLKRVEHVGPEKIVEGVSLDDAITVKADFARWGMTVKIKEGVRPRSRVREAIPERVRREVWRRDDGRCVDCSSRERLEFDHIIPVSEGGANTARNIELRCETCNRPKAARI